MKKIETIWNYLLEDAIHQGRYQHTQKEMALRLGFSLSTIHHALKIPVQMGAVRKESRFFILEDFHKLLYYWASVRNFARDILYQASLNEPILEIEGRAPPHATFACYSAARYHLGEPPADYSKVYWYISEQELHVCRERFPSPRSKKGEANIIFLRKPYALEQHKMTTLTHTFVDLWNLRDWYAKEFTRALEEKINGLLS